jgi:hypothetical protein
MIQSLQDWKPLPTRQLALPAAKKCPKMVRMVVRASRMTKRTSFCQFAVLERPKERPFARSWYWNDQKNVLLPVRGIGTTKRTFGWSFVPLE